MRIRSNKRRRWSVVILNYYYHHRNITAIITNNHHNRDHVYCIRVNDLEIALNKQHRYQTLKYFD